VKDLANRGSKEGADGVSHRSRFNEKAIVTVGGFENERVATGKNVGNMTGQLVLLVNGKQTIATNP